MVTCNESFRAALYSRSRIYDLAHHAEWDPYNLRNLQQAAAHFLGCICTMQILFKLSQPQARKQMIDIMIYRS